ncbi:hypothetical protein J3R30DRAFT_3715276 [Lentinula aciculospora]|uniref:GIY-YIG domain-containing protein n=1 Tax=Lentinula aciculospora TaxID=153920 RepID=A0A9W9DGQ4_9AGAR|nr:hypothetical protein J3R30DRAFT_3715276 [Lentinula aciculospora]
MLPISKSSQVPAEIQMQVGRLGSRSSLISHTFPSFYACYLLKSVQTLNSKATYIGSTPNPPRRIRQHNGELTQGASKTKRGRPWVMHLIVHGFPSRLAALQFEWAWQHPNLSRHIRDENGKVFTTTGRGLKQNIQILRFMISIHPYNIWPLHVKIFTPQSLKIWDGLTNVGKTAKGKGKEKANVVQSIALPRGFTHVVELEGVDGKLAGGSGRTKPIDVQDEKFTTTHLNKYTGLLASKRQLECSLCHEHLEPLTHALCPHHSCNGTAHLLCLSQHFISQNPKDSNAPMVPRGGNCPSCSNFVLWGDVIKGCYRRAAGGAISVEEEAEALDKMYNFDSDSLAEDAYDSASGKRKVKRVVSPRKKREIQGTVESISSSIGEEFDFDEVELERYSDDPGVETSHRSMAGSPSKLKIGKIHLTIPTPVTPSASSRTRKPTSTTVRKQARAVRRSKGNQESSEGELFDFEDVERLSFTDDEAPKRKVGRPKKVLTVKEAIPGPSSGIAKRGRPRKDSSSAGLSSAPSRTPTKRLSKSSKRIYTPISKQTPLETLRSNVLPLFELDDEDTDAEIVRGDILIRRLSSLSVSSSSNPL